MTKLNDILIPQEFVKAIMSNEVSEEYGRLLDALEQKMMVIDGIAKRQQDEKDIALDQALQTMESLFVVVLQTFLFFPLISLFSPLIVALLF